MSLITIESVSGSPKKGIGGKFRNVPLTGTSVPEMEGTLRDSSLKPTAAWLETPLAVRENKGTGVNRGKQRGGENATRLFNSVVSVSLFPPVKTCLRTGLLDITGRDQRGLSILISPARLSQFFGIDR